MIEHDDYRLALLRPPSRDLLVTADDGESRLPRMLIPRRSRLAEELIRSVEQRWRIKCTVIDLLTNEAMPPVVFVEVRTKDWNFAECGLASVPPDAISSAELSDCERTDLVEILNGNAGNRGPFSRAGWMAEAQEWIKCNANSHDIAFTEDVRQLNVGGRFALVRFGTERRPSYWLKAVGEPNTHEFAVTTNFAKTYADYLPPLVCARDDWKAWAMEEFGHPLHTDFTLAELQRVVVFLADMQMRLADKDDQLLHFGCIDQRIETLQRHLPDIMEYLQEVMERQTSTKVPRLSKARLCELKTMLSDTCLQISQLGIPDSLVFGDISSDNILSDGRRCVFTDWCEVYVGNPFVTLEYLFLEVARAAPHAQTWIPDLGALYKGCWLSVLSGPQIERASAFVPVIAIASYLYGRGQWLTSPIRSDPQFQSYSRSLARYMDRAAQNPAFLEALCH